MERAKKKAEEAAAKKAEEERLETERKSTKEEAAAKKAEEAAAKAAEEQARLQREAERKRVAREAERKAAEERGQREALEAARTAVPDTPPRGLRRQRSPALEPGARRRRAAQAPTPRRPSNWMSDFELRLATGTDRQRQPMLWPPRGGGELENHIDWDSD